MLTRFSNTAVRKIDDNTFRITISDESVDRYKSVLKLDGWSLDNYHRNNVVAYNHYAGSPDPDNIIGNGRAWVEGGELMAEIVFEPKELNEKADKIRRKLEHGTLKTASVGFDPIEWSRGNKDQGEDPNILYFRKQELLEFSIVDIPANTNATLKNAYGDFIRMALTDEGVQPEEITEERQSEPVQSEQEHTPATPDIFRNKLFTLKLNTL